MCSRCRIHRSWLLASCAVLWLAAGALAGAEAAPAGAAAEPSPRDGTVILRLDGTISLRPQENLFGAGDVSLYEATMQLRSVLRSPERNVVLDCSHGFLPTLSSAEELAAVITAGKGHKHLTMLIDGTNNQAMVVAAACDEVVMPEAGLIEVDGLALSSYYFADALAKLGIQFHAVISGEHKTAPEALTRSGPSPAGAAELTDLVKGLDDVLVRESLRGAMSAGDLAAARARSPQTSSTALSSKLVDATVEPDGWLASRPGPIRTYKDKKDSSPDLSSLPGIIEFWSQLMQGPSQEKHPKVVAVVELAGEIVEGDGSEPGVNIAPGDTCRMFDNLAADPRVVAVVVCIDSPGGSAEASDRIHHAIKRLEAKKPVVALFDSLAASGGYYIGCAAQQILVHHGTITGSIGVFAVAPDLSSALDHLGVHRFLVSSGPRGDIFGLGPWNDEKEAALRAVVSDTDQRFQALVASCRHIPSATVALLAGGRVYDGDDAVKLQLADGFGTLSSAIASARALAHEPEPLPVERYPQRSGLMARLGLAETFLGPIPTSLRLWGEIAQSRLPVVMAWINIRP